MARQLSEAEIQQRRDAAKARWADAAKVGLGTAGAGIGAYSASALFAGRRAPTREEVKAAWRKDAAIQAASFRREGHGTKIISAVMAGTRRASMDEIAGRLRPIANTRARVAAGVAAGLLGGAATLSAVHERRDREAAIHATPRDAAVAGTLALAGGALKGGLPALEVTNFYRQVREARGHSFTPSRARLAALGLAGAAAGAGYAAYSRKDR